MCVYCLDGEASTIFYEFKLLISSNVSHQHTIFDKIASKFQTRSDKQIDIEHWPMLAPSSKIHIRC